MIRLFACGGKFGWKEAQIFFEPRDIWIGVYWKRYPQAIEFYVCFLPMLPLRLYFQWPYYDKLNR